MCSEVTPVSCHRLLSSVVNKGWFQHNQLRHAGVRLCRRAEKAVRTAERCSFIVCEPRRASKSLSSLANLSRSQKWTAKSSRQTWPCHQHQRQQTEVTFNRTSSCATAAEADSSHVSHARRICKGAHLADVHLDCLPPILSRKLGVVQQRVLPPV